MDSATMHLPCCFLDEFEKLDSGNFRVWKVQVTTILSEYGLLEFLENQKLPKHSIRKYINGGKGFNNTLDLQCIVIDGHVLSFLAFVFI